MPKTVVHSVLLFDGEDVHKNATVIFDSDSGLIDDVFTAQSAQDFPTEATVVDGQGHTLIPGLIEAHMHCYDLHLPPGADTSTVLRSPLSSGVTTCCNMHAPAESAQGLQAEVKAELEQARKAGKDGRVTMADLKSSHLGATIDGGWPKPIVLAGHPTPEVCCLLRFMLADLVL
jgi:dihydroorotase-like cyclic amidohydrolase